MQAEPSQNIYCDESTHLENDREPYLVLGAVCCPGDAVREISVRVREIKGRHGFNPFAEVKWVRVSPANERLYLDLIDYFFDDDSLTFRTVVAPKAKLNHERFNQSHDVWYYKMYFQLLNRLILPKTKNYIYLDIKDAQSADKVEKLWEILANNELDFQRRRVARLQVVRSHESELLQLADVLLGAVNYVNRGLVSSSAKVNLVQRIQRRSGYSLTKSTLPSEAKFNVFHWRPKGAI